MIYWYGGFFVLAAIIGYFVSTKLINPRQDKSEVSYLIQWFAGSGIAISSFGIMFLVLHALIGPFHKNLDDKYQTLYEYNQTTGHVTKTIQKETKDDFNVETLKFNDDSASTATIFFTIAGIALGTLGVLWLGHLESTRLRKDRKHDQTVQIDRLLSLLHLGIDLFLYIDKKELDFVYASKDGAYKHLKYDSITWQGSYYLFLPEVIKYAPELKRAHEEHLTSVYKFLYHQKTFHQNSILSDVHKIIDELKLIYYEKDILLYLTHEERKTLSPEKIEDEEKAYGKLRNVFITLLKQFNDYNNFLSGNTSQSDFSMVDYEAYERKINWEGDKNEETPHEYLKSQFDSCKDKIFYEVFLAQVSKEFSERFLNPEHTTLFSYFKVNEIKDIFSMMSQSNLDASKFFNAYFKESFKRFLTCKKEYASIDLSQKDLSFEEYKVIFRDAFLQINADIKSVKELHSLFYSFISLYNILSDRKDNG